MCKCKPSSQHSQGCNEVSYSSSWLGCRCCRGQSLSSKTVLSCPEFEDSFLQMDPFQKSLIGSGYRSTSPLKRKARACSVFRLRLNSEVGVAMLETRGFNCFPFRLLVFLAHTLTCQLRGDLHVFSSCNTSS